MGRSKGMRGRAMGGEVELCEFAPQMMGLAHGLDTSSWWESVAEPGVGEVGWLCGACFCHRTQGEDFPFGLKRVG